MSVLQTMSKSKKATVYFIGMMFQFLNKQNYLPIVMGPILSWVSAWSSDDRRFLPTDPHEQFSTAELHTSIWQWK